MADAQGPSAILLADAILPPTAGISSEVSVRVGRAQGECLATSQPDRGEEAMRYTPEKPDLDRLAIP